MAERQQSAINSVREGAERFILSANVEKKPAPVHDARSHRPVINLARHVARLGRRNKGVGLERLEQGTKTSDVAVTVDTNDLAAEIGSFRELAQCRRRNRKEIAKHEIVGGGEIDEF